jgi:hypothetical protein
LQSFVPHHFLKERENSPFCVCVSRLSTIRLLLVLLITTHVHQLNTRNKTKLRAMREFEDKQWKKQYEQLVEFKRNNGHCIVPQRYGEDKSLGKWVANQRRNFADDKMQQDRKELLDEIGFVWRVDKSELETTWNTQYEKLAEFKRKNGHCLVPTKYQEDMFFGAWINNQRQNNNRNTLRLDRKGLLDEIGFAWRVDNSDPTNNPLWNKKYQNLVEFKRKNGHCLVPKRYQEDMPLGNWVYSQRQVHRKNKLRVDRKVLLDDIGFVWKVGNSAVWNKQYQQLVEFKRKNGHCIVPRRYREDLSLAWWVVRQRISHTNTSILQDRKDLLDELGFVWTAATRAAHSSTTDVSCC